MARVYLVPPTQPVANAAFFFNANVNGSLVILNELLITAVNDILGDEIALPVPAIALPATLLQKDGDSDNYKPFPSQLVWEMPGGEAATPNGILSLRWAKIRLVLAQEAASNSFTIEIQGLEISSSVVPFMSLSGDLTLAFDEGGNFTGDSTFTRSGDVPSPIPLLPQNVKLLKGDGDSPHQFVIQWQESYTNYWLSRILPDFLDTGQPVESTMWLSFLFRDHLQEIRLDWSLDGGERLYEALGVQIAVQPAVTISLVLYADDKGNFSDVYTVATVAGAAGGAELLRLSSDFTWLRDAGEDLIRELHPNAATVTLPQPRPLSLNIPAPANNSSLILFTTSLQGGGLRFLKPVVSLDGGGTAVTLPSLSLDGLTTPHKSQKQVLEKSKTEGSLKNSGWSSRFSIADGFQFPFLHRNGNGNGSGGSGGRSLSQFIEVKPPDWDSLDLNSASNGALNFKVPVTLKIGDLQFATDLPFAFDWENFAVKVNHPSGINMALGQLNGKV